jgi:hypothetical protein
VPISEPEIINSLSFSDLVRARTMENENTKLKKS